MPIAAVAGMAVGGYLGAGTTLGVAGGMSLGSSIGGLLGGGGSPQQQGYQAQQMVDPFAQYRPKYSAQLDALMQNPSSITSQPGYTAGLNQANQVLQRQAAATGQTQSGAELAALQQQSFLYQQNAYQNQIQNLMTLSGANRNPAAGGQAGINAAQGAATTQSQNVGGVLSALGQLAQTTPTAVNTQVDPGMSINSPVLNSYNPAFGTGVSQFM